MAEIINIPNLSEARLPLNEYDKMRDRIRQLEEDNKQLTDMWHGGRRLLRIPAYADIQG